MQATNLHDYHLHTTFSDGENTPLSIIKACAAIGCKDIAITDHVDQQGDFVYVPEFRGTHNLQEYIEMLEELGIDALLEFGVQVHVGMELITRSPRYREAFREHVAPLCDRVELILVEGWDTEGPVDVAVAAREVLNEMGIKDVAICISHPEFADVLKDISTLVRNKIGLELNESKFSPAHELGLTRMLKIAIEQGLELPRFTLGSDAHVTTDAGKVPIVYQQAKKHGLINRLYWL
jgi:histidinol phosphatase-like PHP family hydrolase